MPQFIKMGLNGTGFLGHPTSSLRAEQRRVNRRRVAAGFPRPAPLPSIEAVREYLAGDRVVCLLCGRSLKKLGGQHLERLHGMTGDEYRALYGIPWTYSLVCAESSANYRAALIIRFEEGLDWSGHVGTAGQAQMARIAKRDQDRPCPRKREIAVANLGEFAVMKPDFVGPIEPGRKRKLTRQEKLSRTQYGTPEYHERMRNRPQVNNVAFIGCWKGRKQSPEHIAKRIAKGMATKAARRAAQDGESQA